MRGRHRNVGTKRCKTIKKREEEQVDVEARREWRDGCQVVPFLLPSESKKISESFYIIF